MATKNEIIQKIENYIRYHSFSWSTFGYGAWKIGISKHPPIRKGQHKKTQNTSKFKSWECNSVKVARDIEDYFLEKKMGGGSGGGKDANHVYVF